MKHVWILIVIILAGCAGVPKAPKEPVYADGCTFYESGYASWYGNEMAKGKRNGEYYFNPTASGEKFIPEGISAAHKTLPFGSIVRVVLDKPGADPHGIIVRINDRGPFVHGRIIDLSRGAARMLKMPDTQPVKIYLCQQ